MSNAGSGATGGLGLQSALDPMGPAATAAADLWWLLFAGAALIFVAVVACVGFALSARASRRRWMTQSSFIVGAGVVFPVVALTFLLVNEFAARPALAANTPALRVEVVGEQWWWRVRYLDAPGAASFATANEIRIPAGTPVEFELHSDNVIHSFWVPSLAGKLDMIPGRVNRLRVVADRAGEYRGQCAEYCGVAHAWMSLHVIAEAPAEFEAWRAAQTRPGREPDDDLARRGQALFAARGCGVCHAVRGSAADGTRGPDLTHVGSRRWLGAARLPNTRDIMAAWIASSQHYKPGNLMPSFDVLPAAEITAIAAYVQGLH